MLGSIGCSATRFAYNHADWYIVREAKRYTCPDKRQRSYLEQLVGAVLSWHRRSELPRYARDLRQLATMLDTPISWRDFERGQRMIEATVTRAARGVRRAFVAYLMRLGPAQQRCIAAKLASRTRERERPLRYGEARFRRERLDAVVKSLERWLGDLRDVQIAQLRATLPSKTIAWSEATASRHAVRRFVELLAEREAKRKRDGLRAVLTARYWLYRRRDRQLIERRSRRWKKRMWVLFKGLDAGQRRALKRKLLTFAGDFDALSRQR